MEPLLQQAQIQYCNVYTDYKLHAIELVEQAIKEGYRKIVAVGGDGTNNEVINGIMCQDIIPSNEILYTLLPIGTGNDWIRQHGIPKQKKAWIQMLLKQKSIWHNVGKVSFTKNKTQHDRYFINVAGMAYDGFVGKLLDNNKGQVFGKLRYLFAAVAGLINYELTKTSIEFDDISIENYCYLINVGICKYSGGGMQLVPHADPKQNSLAITIARNLTKLNVIKSLPLLYNGKLDQHPLISLHHTQQIRINSSDGAPTFLEADGEFLGESPIEITLVEKALQVVVKE